MHTEIIQSLVETHLPQANDLVRQLLACVHADSAEPVAAVYGVYNAGKSSLLNSLTGHVEHEYFETRDIPQTKNTRELVHDGIRFIDTPGLDVSEADTFMAHEGAFKADLIIYVHKLGAGPLQLQDASNLQALVRSNGNPDLVRVVLTEGEKAPDNRELIDEITRQMREIIPGCTPFLVSNPAFCKGVLQGNQVLVHHSGIPQLLQNLQNMARERAQQLEQLRREKKDRLKEQLLAFIGQRIDGLELLQMAEEAREEIYSQGFVNEAQGIQLLIVKAQLEDMASRLAEE